MSSNKIIPLSKNFLYWALIVQEYIGGEVDANFTKKFGERVRESVFEGKRPIIIGKKEVENFAYTIYENSKSSSETLIAYTREQKIKQIINDTES